MSGLYPFVGMLVQYVSRHDGQVSNGRVIRPLGENRWEVEWNDSPPTTETWNPRTMEFDALAACWLEMFSL